MAADTAYCFRDVKVPEDMLAVGNPIAAALNAIDHNPIWYAFFSDVGHRLRLKNANGEELALYLDQKHRITVHAWLPNHLVQWRDYDHRDVKLEISLAAESSAERIAKAIKSRLLPQYRMVFKAADDRYQADQRYKLGKCATFERIIDAGIPGVRPYWQWSGRHGASTWQDKPDDLRFHFGDDSGLVVNAERVTLSIDHLSAEQAIELMSFVHLLRNRPAD
jgi:hypothetical protein